MESMQFYLTTGPYTNPGKYCHLYDNLPDDLVSICRLVKKQLMHPNEVSRYRHVLPRGSGAEDRMYVTVEKMLEELLARHPSGLWTGRKPEERLRVSCRYHSLLLTSMLRYKGVPCRVRAGYASYLSQSGKSHDHWICEVFDKDKTSWVYIDPDKQRIGFPKNEFELPGDVWLKARLRLVNPRLYGMKRAYGLFYIKENLCHDFFCILNRELPYWEGPELSRIPVKDLSPGQMELLDTISDLLRDPDQHLMDIMRLEKTERDLSVKNHERKEIPGS